MISQVIITSDLHLGHRLAAECRGYGTADMNFMRHDEEIIEKLTSQCTKRTVLWILGDVAMRRDSLDLLHKIPGRKILVRGNHDQFRLDDYLRYFEEIYGFLKYKEMWLSHCPIHPQEMYRCKLNVHGHIHKNTNSPLLSLPYFNVNWDFWRRGVYLDEIKLIRDRL